MGIRILALFIPALFIADVWAEPKADELKWIHVAENVWRTRQMPYGYALTEDNACVLFGAPREVEVDQLPPGVKRLELALLTHHHRDSCAAADRLVAAGVLVRAPKSSADYLSPDGVKRYWDKSLPQVPSGEFPPLFHRTWGDWTYLVHPTGIAGIQFDLEDGDEIAWRNWRILAVATPGHSKDHFAFVAQRENSDHKLGFCGDAIAAAGTLWSPYTMEWHHQQDEGFRAAQASLRKLGHYETDVLLPEHGEPIEKQIATALEATSANLERVARLKNFDVFTKEILGDPPQYRFLAEEQVGTANPSGNTAKWSQLSEHLFLTGNTYALVSKTGPVLLMDPYAQNLVQRVDELKQDYHAGPVEVAMISHAHNDHYTGIFALPDRQGLQVWTLDRIADVVDHPYRVRAPYVDPRTPRVDRQLKDGEVVRWHEYEMTIHHLPGQTVYAMGVEVTIDGKRCFFTGDNFYHMDQYSGGGGWSGRNRGLPLGYARSAKLIIDRRPDWILAEHGGAFEFNQEDFQRRLQFALSAAAAAKLLSPHAQESFDWNPHRIHLEPTSRKVKPGERVTFKLVAHNPLNEDQHLQLQAVPRPAFPWPTDWSITVMSGETTNKVLQVEISAGASPGRHVIAFEVRNQDGEQDASDLFVILEVTAIEGVGEEE